MEFIVNQSLVLNGSIISENLKFVGLMLLEKKLKTRIIGKLDVKSNYVVKPVHFEGLRKIGDQKTVSRNFYNQGLDEIFYVDIVASLYQRDIDFDRVRESAADLFVPFGVGGGVRSIDDCVKLFHNGADKIVLNTHIVQERPDLITEIAKKFGSQAVTVSIEAKKWDGWWECYTDGGRVRSSKSVEDWVREIQDRGAGEIFVQSVDTDGRKKGFDIALAEMVVQNSNVPVVIGSGCGSIDHVLDLVNNIGPSGVCISSALHYDLFSVAELKKKIQGNVL